MINYVKFNEHLEIELEVERIAREIYHEGWDAFKEFVDSFAQTALEDCNSIETCNKSFSQEIIDNPHLETAINGLSDNSKDFILAMAAEISKDFPTEFEEVPEPAENTMDSFPSLVKELRYTLSLCHEDKDKKLEKVKELVAKGVNINYRPSTHNGDFPAVFLCVLWDLPEVLKYLISVGLDISIPCSICQDEETAIVYARRTNKKEILEILEAAQKPFENKITAEWEAEESTEKFYKVGDRFVLNSKNALYSGSTGETFEIISCTSQENSVSLRRIDGDFHGWVNRDYQRETPVTDKNKITEEEWECITDNMVENFTKVKIEAEPKEEPEEKEEKKEEEETFYHVGQLFSFEDRGIYVYKLINHNHTRSIRFQKIHDDYCIWLNVDGCLTTEVNNPAEINKDEFEVITDNSSSLFTPITQEEADKIIASE